MLSQLILPSDLIALNVSKIGIINLCGRVYAQLGLAFGTGGERWDSVGGTDALQYAGGDQTFW
jgi:hypothetical protein